jgi:hypothetical protein
LSTVLGFTGVDINDDPDRFLSYCRDCEYSLCCGREESNPFKLQTTVDASVARNYIDDKVAPSILEMNSVAYQTSLEVLRIREELKAEAYK